MRQSEAVRHQRGSETQTDSELEQHRQADSEPMNQRFEVSEPEQMCAGFEDEAIVQA